MRSVFASCLIPGTEEKEAKLAHSSCARSGCTIKPNGNDSWCPLHWAVATFTDHGETMGVARVRGTSWTDTDLIVRVISPNEHAVAGKEFHSLVAAAHMWHGFEDKKTKKPLTDEQVGPKAWKSPAGVPLIVPVPMAPAFAAMMGKLKKKTPIAGASKVELKSIDELAQAKRTRSCCRLFEPALQLSQS